MLIDLLASFDTASRGKAEDRQVSLSFNKPPRVIFLKDKNDFTPVRRYDALSAYTFTPQDQQKISQTIEEISQNGGYDGNQLLFEHLIYDDQKDILYAVAKQAKYSSIRKQKTKAAWWCTKGKNVSRFRKNA